ncbi:hypothetical protein HJFPF1_08112 [Paramyrothecium foliicola]|nr:hypothetical protein HJFPF1_08112 [Paramyrothecium foliicola]
MGRHFEIGRASDETAAIWASGMLIPPHLRKIISLGLARGRLDSGRDDLENKARGRTTGDDEGRRRRRVTCPVDAQRPARCGTTSSAMTGKAPGSRSHKKRMIAVMLLQNQGTTRCAMPDAPAGGPPTTPRPSTFSSRANAPRALWLPSTSVDLTPQMPLGLPPPGTTIREREKKKPPNRFFPFFKAHRAPTNPIRPDNALFAKAQNPRRRTTSTQAPPKPKQFAFISVDSVGKSPSETRKFIRSHVMRGKNTKKKTAPLVEEIEVEPEVESTPALTMGSDTGSDPSDKSSLDFGDLTSYDLSALSSEVATFSSQTEACAPQLPVLTYSPNDLNLHHFSEDVFDPERRLLYKFMISIKETMYPIEWCFHVDHCRSTWFVNIMRDPAYLQACLFAISAMVDIVGNKPSGFEPRFKNDTKFSRKTQLYLRRTIDMLQQRIKESTIQVDDPTTAIVVNLALASDAADDVVSNQAHVQGLRQMLQLRGGLKGYKTNRELQVKICRVELGWCIKTGAKPCFYDEDLVWAPFFEDFLNKYPMYRLPLPRRIQPLLHGIDPRLLDIFNDMRSFTNIVNTLLKSKKKLDPDVHEQSMVSVQYRLLALQYSLDDEEIIEEALRTGLLAYEVSIFLYTPGLKNNYPYLRNRLRECIEKLDPYDPASADLQLWLFLIGSICLYNPDEPWMIPIAAELLHGRTWEDCVERVKDIMWVDLVHNPPGLGVFNTFRESIA